MSDSQAGAQGDGGAVTGTVELTARDLEVPIVEMSALYRARRVLAGALALLIVAAVAIKPAATSWSQTAPQVLFAVVFLAVLYVSPRRAARRILAALTRAGDARVSYRFDGEAITIRAAGSTSSLAYRTLSKAAEGSTAFLLYVNPLVANIVPKRAFSTEDQARARAHVAAHVKVKSLRELPWRLFVIWALLVLAFFVVWRALSPAAT